MTISFKICGLTRPEDARVAEAAGAAYGGVILAPGGKRTVTPARAAVVLSDTSLGRVGVFVDPTPAEVRSAAAEIGLDVAQLHGEESPDVAAEIRASGLTVWKAVRPRSAEDVLRAADRFAGVVHALLLDGWSPLGPGGTGARFAWDEVAQVRMQLDPELKLIVAGGLDPQNVAEAIRALRPDVVDVSSGVETSAGIKDASLVRGFADAVRSVAAERKMTG